MPSVAGSHGRAPDHAVLPEVLRRHRAARLAHVEYHGGRELAVGEIGRMLREPLDRVRQVGEPEPVSRPEPRASAPVHASALGRVAQDQVEDRVEIRLRSRQLDAGAGSLDGRLREDAPGQGAVASMRGGQPGHCAGDGAGRRADVEHLGRLAAEVDVDRFHLRPAAAPSAQPRRRDEEVQHSRGPVARAVDEHEATRSRAGERALGDPGHERSADARVCGIAALGQDACARLGGQRVAGGDCTSHAASLLRPGNA